MRDGHAEEKNRQCMRPHLTICRLLTDLLRYIRQDYTCRFGDLLTYFKHPANLAYNNGQDNIHLLKDVAVIMH